MCSPRIDKHATASVDSVQVRFFAPASWSLGFWPHRSRVLRARGCNPPARRSKRSRMSRLLSRRELLRAGTAGGVALGASALAHNGLIARALASSPACPGQGLGDVEHVVILIQENRSFDHYFGSYRGVTGFADPNALPLNDGSGLNVFAQPGYPGGYHGGHLYPFHFDSYSNGEC